MDYIYFFVRVKINKNNGGYMEILDWEIMNNGLQGKMDNGIILYGASGTGERTIMLLRDLGLDNKILAVVDSDNKKSMKEEKSKWLGYNIFSPDIINSFSKNAIIIIASIYLDEIFKYLHDELKCFQNVCSSFSIRHALHYDIMNKNCDYIEDKIKKKYKKKYNLWRKIEIKKHYNDQENYFIKMIHCIMENSISILLCGMPKTGNTSLKMSFKEGTKPGIVFTFHLSYYNISSLKILKQTLKSFNHNEIKIISGVRQPIERIISKKWQGMLYKNIYDNSCTPSLLDECYEKFIDNLLEYKINNGILNGDKYNSRDFPYRDAYNWFNDHIKKAFDIDIFKYPFDKNKGYSIIKKNNISIFVYRLDKFSNLEKEIAVFSGEKDFKLKNSNIASEKRYAFAYRQYLEQVKVKKDFFDTLVNSKGMTHFYTEEECEEYKNKWKDKLV